MCCASGVSSSGSRPSSSSSSSSSLKSLGTFRNIFHDISGEAFAVDSETILIKVCSYHGTKFRLLIELSPEFLSGIHIRRGGSRHFLPGRLFRKAIAIRRMGASGKSLPLQSIIQTRFCHFQWPADGKRYSYNDDIPLIKRSFDGSEDITLKMPPGADVKDIK